MSGDALVVNLVVDLERRVCDFVARRGILHADEAVLLMLSGGADSMAMLALAGVVDRRLGLGVRLSALHVDYGLRGAESTRDREIVERACAVAGIALEVVRLDAGMRGPNFQARARELRYERARALVAQRGAGVIAVAHNRDDQAETVLYRLAKYASPRALAGMRPREAGAAGRAAVARPLLCLGAGEVRDYCRARGIEYGEDVTNAQLVYARNVVRHEIVPRLAELNPRVVETLAAGAEIAAAEREVLDAVAAEAWARVAARPGGDDVAALDLKRLAREPEALRALCLRTLIAPARPADALIERREIEALARLAERADDAGSVTLKGGWEVARGGGRLRLRRRTPPHSCPPVALEPGGRPVRFCGRSYTAELVGGALWPFEAEPVRPTPKEAGGRPADRRAPSRPTSRLQAFVAIDTPATEVELHHPVRGERFAPYGMTRETTVARFLAAARVARAARERATVLSVAGRVAWVGYESTTGERCGRVAQPFRVSESTGCTLHVVEEEG